MNTVTTEDAMRRCSYAVPFLYAALTLPAFAQTPEAAKPPAPERISFSQSLERLAAGKPVPLVAVSLGRAMGRPQPPVPVAGKPIKEALQDIADAYSEHTAPDATPSRRAGWEADHETLIPFAFPRVWTIARDHQWQFNDKPDVPDVLLATYQTILLPRFVGALTDKQLAAATRSGLTFDNLTGNQQEALRAAFHAPTALFTVAPANGFGGPHGISREFDGILPIEQCTIHLNLAFNTLYVEKGAGNQPVRESYSYYLDLVGHKVGVPESPAAPAGYTFPILVSVPAKLKPGDLVFDDKSLDAPIGASGVIRLDKVVEAAAKATGLVLRVDPRFAGDNVAFIGDSSLRTGDVLRAIAFDVQGAWRRVGDALILTFDREPLAATRQKWEDQLASLDKDRDSLLTEKLGPKNDDKNEERYLRCLEADPDGPPGPTAAQIANFLRPADVKMGGRPDIRDLTFADLTPEQQEAVRLAMRVNGPAGKAPDPDSPELQVLLPKAQLNDLSVRMTMDVPNVGRYQVEGLFSHINPGYMAMTRAIHAGAFDTPQVQPDESITLAEKERAVAVPPLPRTEWPRLLTQMRRKGLTTLYLPVLFDGYTLYPSRQFPLQPLAKGKDMLADVLAQAKEAGVRVIAVLNCLAWRNPGGSDLHWLRKRPDLLDRDVAGVSRRDWTMAHLPYLAEHRDWDYGRLAQEDAFLFGDMVRPADPSVKQRLLSVLAELKGYKGLSGVALAEWSRISCTHYLDEDAGSSVGGPPDLGYDVLDRAAFIKEHSVDPADIEAHDYSRLQVPTFASPADMRGLPDAWSSVRMNQDATLLKSLKDEAEKTWPGGVHILSPLNLSSKVESGAISKADVDVRPRAFLFGGDWDWTAPTPDIFEGVDDPTEGKAPDRLADFLTSLSSAESFYSHVNRQLRAGALLDFRAAPSLLWPALARIKSAQ